MKTTTQKNKNVRLWMLNIIMLTTIAANAETTYTFTKAMEESLSGDRMIGVYVVFGILACGIIGSIIVSKLEKLEKTRKEGKIQQAKGMQAQFRSAHCSGA